MRASVLALLLAFGLGTPAWAQPPQEDPATIQREFDAALSAEAAGSLEQAIVALEALQERTRAPRIRLELARMLFRAGEHRRARAVFDAVYREDLPYPVRRTLNLFLDDIDQRIGYLRPSFSLSVDDNPVQQPKSGTYDLFGFPLEYRSTAEPAVTATLRLDGLAPLGGKDERRWQLRASAEGAASEAAGARRHAGEISLRYARLDLRSHFAAGYRVSDSAGFRADAAFVEYFRRFTPRGDRQWTVRAAVEANRFPDRPSLDGETVRLSVDHVRDLGPNTSLILGGGASASGISDPQWPRVTAHGQATLVRSLPNRNLNLVAGAAVSGSDFEGPDLFFGREREDRSYSLQVAAYHARPVLGFFPGVVASHEVRRSNIPFYGYRRSGLSVDLRRRF